MSDLRSSSRKPRQVKTRSFVRVFMRIAWSFFVIATTLYAGGFLVYIAEYQRAAESQFDKADAIVVLTGGPDRIAEAVKLLANKASQHLLISGVNEQTDEDDLVRTVPGLQKFMACCVTLDRSASNTHENALQTLAWAKANKFQSLIVVTAHAHLPRALFELRVSGGDQLQLSPWRVGGPARADDWWQDPVTIRSMLIEYTKLVGSIIRYFFTLIIDAMVKSG